MPSPGMLGHVALIGSDVSKKRIASTANSCHPDNGGDNVPQKYRFLQESHGVTSQKAAFFLRVLCSRIQSSCN
jgi:hypothetical protein